MVCCEEGGVTISSDKSGVISMADGAELSASHAGGGSDTPTGTPSLFEISTASTVGRNPRRRGAACGGFEGGCGTMVFEGCDAMGFGGCGALGFGGCGANGSAAKCAGGGSAALLEPLSLLSPLRLLLLLSAVHEDDEDE